MKIHILSDLHNEFFPYYQLPPDIVETDAEVIILAGDIDIRGQGVEWAIRQSERLGKPVIYVAGNHEYYGMDFPAHSKTLHEMAAGSNVHVLERGQLVLNGIRFLGCTLWTDFCLLGTQRQEEAMEAAANGMTDYQRISNSSDGLPISPRDILAAHRQDRQWLEDSLVAPHAGRTVVITHAAPSPQSKHPAYPLRPFTASFVVDMEYL
ncbi:MAG: phosphoesterase, partial [Gammaproteobacteria bacterium]|nr:phosphoesterase [Gammaproteobacteria bacterium]